VRNSPLDGYDPYDLLSLNGFTQSLMQPFQELPFFKKLVFLVIIKSNDWFPLFTRKILLVKRKVHPTYVGLLLHTEANLPLEQRSMDQINLLKNKLMRLRLTDYSNACWGTPFAWWSGKQFYPIGTPFTVVTAWIGEAFLKLYEELKLEHDLEICESIAQFFICDLQRLENQHGDICFSYSPLAKNDINNSNLMVAAYLSKLGKITSNNHYIDLAKKATSFSISTQLDSGLIPYFGNAACDYNDSYHSSYELKSIFDVMNATGNKQFKSAFEKYLNYYLLHYFQEDYSITKYPNRLYPVDGTALADGYVLLQTLLPYYPKLKLERYINGLDTLIEKEWMKSDGGIRYKKLSKHQFTSITYTRWIMGWFALAASYSDTKKPLR
jgi:hypothetical protein